MTVRDFPSTRSAWMILAAIFVAYVLIRVPVAYCQPGGQDEDCYGFPGLTIVEDGVPRLPHVPQRDPSRFFHYADDALFAEPPLYFYWQSLFFAALPDVYGTARLSSIAAGAIAIGLVYVLARRWYRDEAAALWAAGIYSLLRMFYFPAFTARPDILCAAIGLAALYTFDRWTTDRKRSWFLATGVLIGLGGLAHPFAIVYAVQIAVWAAVTARGWARLLQPALLAATAIMVCLIWLPLILSYPEAFEAQFGNNILKQGAGDGFFARQLMPWTSLAHHAALMWEHAGPIQFTLLALGTAAALAIDGRDRNGNGRKVLALAISSAYLLSTITGPHPTKGYWCYPAALLCLCLGRSISYVWSRLAERSPWWRRAGLPAGIVLIALLVPGLGIRAWWAYVGNFGDVNYNAPRFARQLMDDLPEDARYTVDVEYALDFYAADRTLLMGQTNPIYFSAEKHPYDYLIVSRHGLRTDLAGQLNGTLLRTYGVRDDPFACYVEVYIPAER